MSTTFYATFNPERTERLRRGCADGWFDYKPEPEEKEVFIEHCFHLTDRRLWLNEMTKEFVVTDNDGNVLTPEYQEKAEAQKYWEFLDKEGL